MNEYEQKCYLDILSRYSLPDISAVEIRDSGMNNTTRYAVLQDESVRVLRVYENHRDADKLRTEHEVLAQLHKQALPFSVPCPLETRDGLTWTEAPDGKLAALFTFLKGRRPSSDRSDLSAEYGRTVAYLVQAMAGLELKEPSSYPAYDELLETPPDTVQAVLRTFQTVPALTDLAWEAEGLTDLLAELQHKTPDIRRLPRQMIHGDFSYANSLVEGDRVVGVLDFEFATRDIRAMELAVCLAEQLSVPGRLSLSTVQEIMGGYQSVLPLEMEERRLLPELILLRKLDVFLHFWNRFETGLDRIDVLRQQTKRSASVCRFVCEHRSIISG